MPVESLQTGQFRHGPLELAGPDLAAVVIATEPETPALDLALADELLTTGTASPVVTTDDRPPDRRSMRIAIGPLDRALAPAVLHPALPAAGVAARGDSAAVTQGAYHRAAKVTTHE